MKGHDQQYGLIEMEILLELDCGLDVEFEPDWVSDENYGDHTKVRWQLPNSPDKNHLDDLLSELEAEKPIYEPDNLMASLRLLHRYDS